MTRRILSRLRHSGFAIVSAIFLLVVLAALGVGMMVFSTSQQAESGYDLQGARAYQAARAGIEWALYNRLNPNASAASGFCQRTAPSLTAGTSSSTVNNGTFQLALPTTTPMNTLAQFSVTITCTAITNVPNTNTIDPTTNQPVQVVIRTIVATACNQPVSGSCPGNPGTDYVQRKVQVTLQESN